MLTTMITAYNTLAYTHEYIFGFILNHKVYLAFANADVLPFVCCLDKVASTRKGGNCLRFKPTKAQKNLLMGQAQELCDECMFNTICENSKYNKGEIFEKLVTEFFGQEWVKDNVPFTVDGDLTVNGVAYQIKFQSATFCTETSLENLRKKLAK